MRTRATARWRICALLVGSLMTGLLPAASASVPTTASIALVVETDGSPEGLPPAEMRAAVARVAGAATAAAMATRPLDVPGFVHVTVPGHAATVVGRALRAHPRVRSVEPDGVARALAYTPSDPLFRDQWALSRIDAPVAWDVVLGASTTVVAVLDTGIDGTHPDLRGALVPGVNLVEPGTPPTDRDGHGTEVAGIIAARHDNGRGGVGVCPRCSVMPVKVLDDDGVGDLSRIAEGIVAAVDRGARVLNLSLGAFGGTNALRAAVTYAHDRGAVLVASAGNYGDTGYATAPLYPAAYEGVLGVAGSDPVDRLATWTTHGSWVDVAAPGCGVTTALGGGAAHVCGSSTAAPMVAGVGGLALSARPTSAARVLRDAVTMTARPLSGVRHGRVTAAGAVRATSTLAGLAAPDPRWAGWSAQPGSGVSGQGVSAPGVVSWGAGRSDVFVTDEAGRLLHRWELSSGWGPGGGWEVHAPPSGVRVVGQPAAVSRRAGWIDVFVRGSDDAVWQRSYVAGRGWLAWQRRGGVVSSSPGAVSWGRDHVAVVVAAPDGAVWHLGWDGRRWSRWRSLGGGVTSAPSVVSWEPGRMDVFVRGSNGALYHRWFLGGRWGGSWVREGGLLHGDGAPGATSWGSGRLDAFVVGRDGSGVWRRGYQTGFGWLPTSGFEGLGSPGGVLASGTAAVSWGAGHLEVFVTDSAGRLWSRSTT